MKKIIVSFFIILFVFANNTFSYIKIGDFIDNANNYTYVDVDDDGNKVLNGKLAIIGDSYAYILSYYSGYKFKYSVHPGYNTKKINEELVNNILNKNVKYCYIYIGPNDFMEQTNLAMYNYQIQNIIDKLKANNIQPIFSEYFEPDYKLNPSLLLNNINCKVYSDLIKRLCDINKCWHLDIIDLYKKYGHEKDDFVHPNSAMAKYVMERLIDFITIQENTGNVMY